MKISSNVHSLENLPPAYRRAVNIEHDLGSAIGLFSLGIKSHDVLRTLAAGKAAYDSIGKTVPRPTNINAITWDRILTGLAHYYGERPYIGGPVSDAYSGSPEQMTLTAA